jgi:uncharacterized protein YbjT (DUF2867 family)
VKLVVIGGSGLIGSKLVSALRQGGHDVTLAVELEGAHVVVDVLDVFEMSYRRLLSAEAAAGVAHHVMLSVVGADRLPHSAWFRAKLAREEVVKAGPVPYTIVRATQPFEVVGQIADSSTVGNTVRLPRALVYPATADDVAATLADVAVGTALNDTVELAGPEAFALDDLARRVLDVSDDPRRVVADVHARYFGAELDDHSLVPGDDARIAPTRFDNWLSVSPTERIA